MKEGTEIISLWVNKNLAREIEKAKDQSTKEEMLIQYVDSIKCSYKEEIESLSDDVLQMKAAFITVKKELAKTRDEILQEQEIIWSDFQSKVKSTKEFTNRIASAIKPINDDIGLMRNRIQDISFINIERFESILSSIKRMTKEEKDFLLKFMNKDSAL